MNKSIHHLPGPWRMLLLIAFLALISSCTTGTRKLTYVHGIETGKVHGDSMSPEEYLIKPNDHLYIVIMGDDPLNTAYLNLTTAVSASAGSNLELITYTVNEHGNISFPQLGELAVEGKTVLEIQTDLQEKIGEYIKNTSVYVKLVDRTITVIGEVMSPGNVIVFKSQLTIFEAIGSAGDLTDWGNRRDVKLFRKTKGGTEVVSLDLTDPALLYSDYYYIFPNDVIYVEPRSRVFGFKTLDFPSIFTMILAIVTTALLVHTYVTQ